MALLLCKLSITTPWHVWVILFGVSSVVCGSTNKSGILSASPRVLQGNFWWNLQLHLPPQVDFTPSFLAGDTPRCSLRPVVFPYFTARKYHPGGILGTTSRFVEMAKKSVRTFYLGSVPASDVMPLDGVHVVVLEGVPRVKKR
jgi:hypothetical protein